MGTGRKRLRVIVRGRVQGIGFRWFARETAERMRVGGWVRNLSDGGVELEAEGEEDVLRKFLSALKTEHPFARIDSIDSREIPSTGAQGGFEIR